MRYLLIAALLPAVFLMNYIYKRDRVEKEPAGLLWMLALGGAVSCLPAALIERVALGILDYIGPFDRLTYAFIEAFLIVAAAEEFCKRYVLKHRTWNDANFNCTFDGIVYAVFTSLGFAALENVKYALTYGASVLGSRAIFSIPGHATFGVYMGVYYARAKMAEARGDFPASNDCMRKSLTVPVLLHGFYDFCLISEMDFLSIVFILFVIILDIRSIKLVKKESALDRPIYPEDENGFNDQNWNGQA